MPEEIPSEKVAAAPENPENPGGSNTGDVLPARSESGTRTDSGSFHLVNREEDVEATSAKKNPAVDLIADLPKAPRGRRVTCRKKKIFRSESAVE